MEVEEEVEADESAVWALWGRYEKATLGAVQQGMYEVHFASGGSRWTTVMELALPEHKTSAPLAVGVTVLLPDGDGYVVGTVQSVFPNPAAPMVRREDAQGEEVKVAAHELCIPLASGPMLGACPKLLEKGTAVYALRGRWLPAQVVESVQGLHRLALQLDTRAADVWVGGGQLASRLEPDDPATLVAGAHVLMEDGVGAATEGQLLEPDDGSGSALVQLMGGEGDEDGSDAPALVPVERLRLRYDPCFRVLAPTGGLLPGEVVEQGADGLLLVKLQRGGQRWASAAEIFAQAPPSPEQLTQLLPHSLVAALPQPLSADAAAPRWISAGVVGAAAAAGGDAGAPLALRRPTNQRRCSVTMVRKDGRFGLDLDDQNRVVSVQPGSGSDGLGIQVGDQVVECDGAPVPHNGLAAAVKGKEHALLGLRTPGDDSEAGAAAGGGGGGEGGSWAVEAARVRLPLLSKATCAAVSVAVGSSVFVLDGPWAEAVVEEQEDGFYLLHYGGGERRWASSGEIAWHDIAPMPYDVAAGKQAPTPAHTRTGLDTPRTRCTCIMHHAPQNTHHAPHTTHHALRTTHHARRRMHCCLLIRRAHSRPAGARVARGAELHGAGDSGARKGRQPAGGGLRRRRGLGEAARHDPRSRARAVAHAPPRTRPVGQLPQGKPKPNPTLSLSPSPSPSPSLSLTLTTTRPPCSRAWGGCYGSTLAAAPSVGRWQRRPYARRR